MSRARDNANLGAQAGSGLDASDITTGVLPVGVTGGSGLTALGTVATGTLGGSSIVNTSGAITTTGAFTSVGIDDNASGATAITIDSDERVGIQNTSPTVPLAVGTGTEGMKIGVAGSSSDFYGIGFNTTSRTRMNFFGGGTTEFMCLTDQGNVGIGTAAPANLLHLNAANAGLRIEEDTDNDYMQIDMVQGSRARISLSDQRSLCIQEDSGETSGYVGIGHQPSYHFDLKGKRLNDFNMRLYHADTSGNNRKGFKILYESTHNNYDSIFLQCETGNGARCIIYSNGQIQNVDGTYGSFSSDERLKIDIKDANSQWDDVKNINIVNYKRLVDGEDDYSKISVIAQQVKNVSPKLVGERSPEANEIKANPLFGTLYEDGDEIPEGKKIGDVKEVHEKVLFFKDSIFFWKCAKALQEAMAKIEILQTKVTALENA